MRPALTGGDHLEPILLLKVTTPISYWWLPLLTIHVDPDGIYSLMIIVIVGDIQCCAQLSEVTFWCPRWPAWFILRRPVLMTDSDIVIRYSVFYNWPVSDGRVICYDLTCYSVLSIRLTYRLFPGDHIHHWLIPDRKAEHWGGRGRKYITVLREADRYFPFPDHYDCAIALPIQYRWWCLLLWALRCVLLFGIHRPVMTTIHCCIVDGEKFPWPFYGPVTDYDQWLIFGTTILIFWWYHLITIIIRWPVTIRVDWPPVKFPVTIVDADFLLTGDYSTADWWYRFSTI